jgi:ubiquinone/menaquinone biosynthesis C-methylase UbiE
LYLRDYFEKTEKVDFLDIAPSTSLGNFIKGHKNVNYRSVDLYMEGVTDKADVSDLHIYKDNQFDFILCSHVLEHVPEDAKAIKELYRVLSKTGRAILMVPINLGITETIEDPYSTDIAKNWKFFGQGDHVRVYSRSDYIKRLKDGGFYVEELDIKYFGAEVFEKAAINPTSVLYVGHKNDPRN